LNIPLAMTFPPKLISAGLPTHTRTIFNFKSFTSLDVATLQITSPVAFYNVYVENDFQCLQSG